jgi:hypothetical protein
MKKSKRRIIQVPVPKEIWDAHMSIWNMFANRDIIGAWMRSVQDTINQMNKK